MNERQKGFGGRALLLGLLLLPLPILADGPSEPGVRAATDIDAGRYLVTIGACNDCHTAEWTETDGKVAEADWLTGVAIGWRGPWGTTYASNLRLLADDISEDAFVAMLKSRKDRPPMPWMNVAKLSDGDARAIYRFIASLGPAGERMPAAVAPDAEPGTAYFMLDPMPPKILGKVSAAQ